MGVLKEKFCARLRVLRAERGLSQENLASMLDMSINGYAKIERGETDVSIGKIEEIARLLEVDVADMLQLATTNNYVSHGGHAHVVNSQGTFHIKGGEDVLEKVLYRLMKVEMELEEMRRRVK